MKYLNWNTGDKHPQHKTSHALRALMRRREHLYRFKRIPQDMLDAIGSPAQIRAAYPAAIGRIVKEGGVA